MARILIKNGKVWDGEKFSYADVLTDGRKIISVAQGIDAQAGYIYDATDKIVSTGLVDIHTHMLGGCGINAEMSCIPFGVTAAAEVHAMPECRERYDNFLVKNRLFICADIENNSVKYENTLKLLRYYEKKAVGIKVYFDTCLSQVKDISALKETVEFAHNNNLIVMVHSSNSPVPMSEIVSVLEKGDILTHAYHGGIHNAADDDYQCLKEARRKGIVIDVGFAANVHADFAVLGRAIEKGCIPDTISTDITKFSAYKRGGRYGMTMCMSIAKELGMKEEDIFRAVTSTPAKALGRENEWGHLNIDRCADLAVLEYSNEGFDLTDKEGNRIVSQTGYRCVLSVIDGEIVYRI